MSTVACLGMGGSPILTTRRLAEQHGVSLGLSRAGIYRPAAGSSPRSYLFVLISCQMA